MEDKTKYIARDQYENDVDVEINIQNIFLTCIRYWKWFALSIAFCLVVGFYIYLKSEQTYMVSMSVLVKEDKGTGAKGSGVLGNLQDLGLINATSNINNEIAMLSSPILMKQVVRTLDLQISYYKKDKLRIYDVYKSCPYYVHLEGIPKDSFPGYIEITLKPSNSGVSVNGTYFVNKEELSIKKDLLNLSESIDIPNSKGKLYVAKRAGFGDNNVSEDDEYLVKLENERSVSGRLADMLSVEPYMKGASALNLSIKISNIQKGVDIMNQLMLMYNEENVRENNQMASSTSLFVNKHIEEVGRDLAEIEHKIENYKKQRGIVDLASETQLYMSQTGAIVQKNAEIETELNVVNLVENFIENPENNYRLIPNIGISDPGLSSIIMEYNNMLIQYEYLESNTNENSPARIRLDETLKSMRTQIISSVQNVKRAITITKKDIDKQKTLTASRINAIPMQERELLELMRKQQTSQTLYLFLLQTSIETNITMASSADKAKIIAEPTGSGPIAPRGGIILSIAFLIGLILPVIFIYIKERLNVNINDLEELEKLTTIPVLEEILTNESSSTIVVRADRKDPIAELFRSLRNNIRFILDSPDKKIILVTSTIPNEGKTFIGANLAASFALSSGRVLLMGMDLRNPQIANMFGVDKSRGISEYLSGQEDGWSKLVLTSKMFPNLDILQAGTIPPNPNELLMKPSLKTLMSELRSIYDIIIIDSAPLGIISDTFLLKSIPDITLYVTREKVTPKNAINFINDVSLHKKMPNVYLVLNDVSATDKGKYGKYSYRSSYGYEQKK
ncbi:polysaccharide biosynthesis tyrosine autokinase [Dysgonomonas sp. 216]|uniref:GumC family protein n=1 Tax=Dysgonomonas sp. 216 TaxID=2302934 RepID=UPI0013D26D09|nr:polysaccharide biosynthesis tyrosine autokinase [Dysgonomonas sp. 216]NDW18236.1 polysaccharide biosynthesis tyrosine autokinase [Dysgonomonas sp. 216]